MSTESDLRAFVTGDAGCSAIIGSRMHAALLPQDGVYPALVFKRIFSTTEQSHDGSSHLRRPHYQFDLYTHTETDIEAMLNALEALFLPFKGTTGTTAVGAILHVRDSSVYETATRLFHGIFEFEIWHQT